MRQGGLPGTDLAVGRDRLLRTFRQPELSLVPYLCDPNRDAIDIGANIGCYTLFMRHHARHVYAFEPILGSRSASRGNSTPTT